MEKIKIIHEPSAEKPFLVIYKPKGLPSAPLSENDFENALSQAIKLYPQLNNVTGKKQIEYGLLHRIDTPTDGLLVIASTQEAYDFLIEQQQSGRFIKYYSALCEPLLDNSEKLEGFPPVPAINNENFTIESYFRPYGNGNKEVRPVTQDSGKAALKKNWKT